jgi:hypothetical protein
MPVLPTKIEELLTFADNHQALWVSQAAAIGLSAPQALLFKNAAAAARTDFNAQVVAEQAKLAATSRAQVSIRALRKVGGETINLIKAFAETQANPDGVYQIAQIPSPAIPSPRPVPGTPNTFRAILNEDGSITLRWKCDTQGAAGTVYNITRKNGSGGGGGGPAVYVGSVGTKSFTDLSIPAGTTSVQYVVTAQRAEAVGLPSSPYTVLFGGGGLSVTGATIAAQFSGEAPAKLAA